MSGRLQKLCIFSSGIGTILGGGIGTIKGIHDVLYECTYNAHNFQDAAIMLACGTVFYVPFSTVVGAVSGTIIGATLPISGPLLLYKSTQYDLTQLGTRAN